MFCSHCGTQVDDGANFCKKCGAKLGPAGEPVSPAPAQTPRPVTAPPISAPVQSAPPSSPSSPESRSSKGPLFVVAGVVVLLLAGAGIYFGTDVLRQPAKSEAVPSAPPQATVMEAPPATGADAAKLPVELLSRATGESAGNSSSSSSGGGATPGTYQTIRPTSVHEAPSASAKVVAKIDSGIPVNVVGSNGDWLEVRSKSGKPPGFIPRGDATLTEPAR